MLNKTSSWDNVEPNCGRRIVAKISCQKKYLLAIYFILNCKKASASLWALKLRHFGSVMILLATAIGIISCESGLKKPRNHYNSSLLKAVVLSVEIISLKPASFGLFKWNLNNIYCISKMLILTRNSCYVLRPWIKATQVIDSLLPFKKYLLSVGFSPFVTKTVFCPTITSV